MSAYYLEWLNLLGRWAHMITGIAWVGASFYFVWLDNHLLEPVAEQDREKGVATLKNIRYPRKHCLQLCTGLNGRPTPRLSVVYFCSH